MRIWDLKPNKLCDKHLLGEHFELHCIFTYLTTPKGGSYKKHPEVLRWKNKLYALFLKHEEIVKEMKSRSFKHFSDLPKQKIKDTNLQNKKLILIKEQIKLLKQKNCLCNFQKWKK